MAVPCMGAPPFSAAIQPQRETKIATLLDAAHLQAKEIHIDNMLFMGTVASGTKTRCRVLGSIWML
eukprot:5162544-Amphidinium_carterae.1